MSTVAGSLRGDLVTAGSTERGFKKYPLQLGPLRGDLVNVHCS